MKTLAKTWSPALTVRHYDELRRLPAGRVRECAQIEMEYLNLPPERAGEYVDAVLRTLIPAPLREVLASLPAAEVGVEAADNVIKVTVRLPAS